MIIRHYQKFSKELVLDTAYDYDNDYNYVDPPKWSAWSEWSECNEDCLKARTRQCLLGTGNSRKNCYGKDTQTMPCPSEMCKSMELTRVKE
ncbi:hypothetical protein GWI33_011223, partial [Rhynchophorus ferrugineus]